MFNLVFTLAFNNAFLRLSRTLLVTVMIAVSMSMMLALQGLYAGMTFNIVDGNKRSDTGDVAIYQKGYRLSHEIKDRIYSADKIVKKLEGMQEVKKVVSRIHADGLVATARKSRFGTIVGINLADEEKFGKFSDFLHEGELSFKKHGVLVGLELAKKLKVKIGSKLIFSTQDSLGEINSLSLRVRGIVQTTNLSLDRRSIFIEKEKLRKFLGIEKNEVTQIAVMLKKDANTRKIKEAFPALDVKTFLELVPLVKMLQDTMGVFNSITFFIVMLVVFIGIMGVMYVSILDRIREFGIMKSIGYSYKYIRLQIFLEAFLMALSGYILGAILGYLALWYLHDVGLDLKEYADGLESFGYTTVMYAQIKFSYFTTTFVAIVSASLLSVLLPLRKIKKMNTIEVTKVNT